MRLATAIRRTLIASTAAVAAALVCATGASAAIPTTAAFQDPAADYKGWAYVRTDAGAATADIWKWDAAGWQSGTAAAGSYVWLWPWGSGWNWAWRDGAWHAIKTANTTVWSCGDVTGDAIVFPKQSRTDVPVLSLASAGSASAGAAGLNDRITLSCGTGFKDAKGGDTVWALVNVTEYSWCTVWTLDCVVNPPVKRTFSGYVDVTKIADDPPIPPQNGDLGTLPA
jgi:hypothetical protein